MQLIDDLRSEHVLIERVVCALRAFVEHPDANQRDARRFVHFFRTYAGEWHHEREEDVLFRAITDELLLPGDRGPVAVLLGEHRGMAALLNVLDESTFDSEEFRLAAYDYSEALLHHIDAENSVLFPECEARLARAFVELPSRELTQTESEAAAVGEELVATYGAPPPADVVRGDGCAICPQFGDTCSGIEREWWNEWEWEELSERVAST